MMESRGNLNYPGGGPESFASTLHWGPDFSTNQFEKTHAEKSIEAGTLADDFHTYGLYWDDKVLYTYLDTDDNKVLHVDHSQISYWERSGLSNRDNPWANSPDKNAPFDREFYLIINLAVGGTSGYFPDGVGSKPWSDTSPRASSEFYDNKGQWLPTWGGHSTFQVDSVKVWDLSGIE
jgi:hypothetical protein